MPNGTLSVSPSTISTCVDRRCRACRRRSGRRSSRGPGRGCGVPVKTVTVAGRVHADGARSRRGRRGRRARPPRPTARGRRPRYRWRGRCRAACRLLSAFRLARREARPVGGLQRHVEASRGSRRCRIAAATGVWYGKASFGMRLRPADLDPVDAHLARRHVDQALEQEGRLRPAGAAIGVDRHGVGEDRLHLGSRSPASCRRRRAACP